MSFITLGGEFMYNPADILGNGAFAIVYKGHFKNNPNKKVAIKRMLKDQNIAKAETLLSKEISVLKGLNHENIVSLYDHNISSNGVYLVMEYCNAGDLAEYLQLKRTLKEDTICRLLYQIGSAMDAMYKQGIMHRDLKPGNILLQCNGEFKQTNDIPGSELTFKLADFGFARYLKDGMMAVTMCGSPMYMAPEVLMCKKYDSAADIWSMGIIVFQCLTGKAPFYANTPEALKNIYEKAPILKPKIPPPTSPDLTDLLYKMLVRKPSNRIDYKSFLVHPFIRKGASKSDEASHGKYSNIASGISGQTRNHSGFPPSSKGHEHSPYGQMPAPSATSNVASPVRNSPNLTTNLARKVFHTEAYHLNRQSPLHDPGRSELKGGPKYALDDDDSSGALTSEDLCMENDDYQYDDDDMVIGAFSRKPLGTDHHLPNYQQRHTPQYDRRLSQPQATEVYQKDSDDFVLINVDGTETAYDRQGRYPYNAHTNHAAPSADRHTAPLESRQHSGDSGSFASYDRTRRYGQRNSSTSSQSPLHGSSGYAMPPSTPSKPYIHPNTRLHELSRLPTITGSPHQQKSSSVAPAGQATADTTTTLPSSYSLAPSLNNLPHGAVLHEYVEYSDEMLLDNDHVEELKKITMVLELCELLSELADRKSSMLPEQGLPNQVASDVSATPTAATGEGVSGQTRQTPNTDSDSECGIPSMLSLESKKIGEQIILYRRVLYYLEYVYVQANKASQQKRLKPTESTMKRLRDCNALYHRSYIRLRQLAKQSQRTDLVESVGTLVANLTANKLIFQHALDQCCAAEMDEYIGEIRLCLQRYKAAIILLYGLIQHAKSTQDKEVLNDCFRLVHERYSCLWEQHANAEQPVGMYGHPGGASSSRPTSQAMGTDARTVSYISGLTGEVPVLGGEPQVYAQMR